MSNNVIYIKISVKNTTKQNFKNCLVVFVLVISCVIEEQIALIICIQYVNTRNKTQMDLRPIINTKIHTTSGIHQLFIKI